jgi:hypothetical protein
MQPSNKSALIEDALTGLLGHDRKKTIESNHCIPAPIGCGREIPEEEFGTWAEIELREYAISAWCKTCQDKVFSSGDE